MTKEIPVMASRAIVTLLSLVLATGCAQIKAAFTPAPPPPLPSAAPARPERLEPPPRLSPQVSSDRERQLMEEVNTMIQGADRTLLSIDRRKLKSDQWEIYQTIHSFLTQARLALSLKDFRQARNLAQKAQVLSDELYRTLQ